MTIMAVNYSGSVDQISGVRAPAAAVPAAAVPVLICLLVQFQVMGRGGVLRNNSQKAEQLLSTLALSPHQATARSFLLDVLWPDTNSVQSGVLLRGLLHKVRLWFAGLLNGQPLVVRDEDTFRLNLDAGVRVDMMEFERHVACGDQAVRWNKEAEALQHYADAAHLYRGDLLAYSCADVEIERERLRGLYLRATGHLAHQHFSDGDFLKAIDYAQRMLRTNPFHEDAHRVIMRSYARRNERGQALRQFQLCQSMLYSEFNIQPELETLALYELIRLHPARV